MTVNLIAWIIGFGAIACSVIAYQQQKRNRLLCFKLLSDGLWFAHYFCLGLYTPMATNILAALRETVFFNKERIRSKGRLPLYIFCVLYLGAAALTWKNALSLLPALSSICSTTSFWMADPRHTKLISIPAALLTITYNIFQGQSLPVYIGAGLSMVSAISSLIEVSIKNKKKTV